MSKSQGTVGRTPRKRPVPNPPKRPKTPPEQGLILRYKSGSDEITQAEADRLVYYPDAKDDESTPISERVVRPTRGKYKPIYDETVERIDQVHNYPAKAAPVVMRSSKLRQDVLGNFAPKIVAKKRLDRTLEFKDAGLINIDAAQQSGDPGTMKGTGTHEIGHDIDRFIQDAPQRKYDPTTRTKTEKYISLIDENYNSQQAFNALEKLPKTKQEAREIKILPEDDAYVRWAKTVVKTDAYWNLKKGQDAQEKGLGQKPYVYYVDPDTGEEYKRTHWVPGKRRNTYVLSPTEIFARGYAQYIATKTNDKESLSVILNESPKPKPPQANPDTGKVSRISQLHYEHARDDYEYYRGRQWKRKDFGPLAEAYDDIFRERGLLHE